MKKYVLHMIVNTDAGEEEFQTASLTREELLAEVGLQLDNAEATSWVLTIAVAKEEESATSRASHYS